MPSLARRALFMPFWLAQILTQEKFFARNPVIGNRWLNEHGLHAARVIAACRLAAARRRRLARLIAAEDKERFDRDGFIVKRDFLPPAVFADLTAQIRALRAPAREMTEGDTVTRHIALDPAVLDRVPAARRLLDMPEYRNLIRYDLSPDRQGVAVPDRRHARCDAVRLCPGLASPDAATPPLGTADEHRGEPAAA